MKTIDITPTWSSLINVFIYILQDKNSTNEGKKKVKEALIDMAKKLDLAIEAQNK